MVYSSRIIVQIKMVVYKINKQYTWRMDIRGFLSSDFLDLDLYINGGRVKEEER